MNLVLGTSFVVEQPIEECLARLAAAIEPEKSFQVRKTAMFGGRPLTGQMDGNGFCVSTNGSGTRPSVVGRIAAEAGRSRVRVRMSPTPWLLILFFLASNTMTTMAGVQLRQPLIILFWFTASSLWLGFHLMTAWHVMTVVREVMTAGVAKSE